MRLLLPLLLLFCFFSATRAELLDDINDLIGPYLQDWQDFYNSYLTWTEYNCFAINGSRGRAGITPWESFYYGLWDGFTNCEARDSNTSGISLAESHNSLYQASGRIGAFLRGIVFFWEYFV